MYILQPLQKPKMTVQPTKQSVSLQEPSLTSEVPGNLQVLSRSEKSFTAAFPYRNESMPYRDPKTKRVSPKAYFSRIFLPIIFISRILRIHPLPGVSLAFNICFYSFIWSFFTIIVICLLISTRLQQKLQLTKDGLLTTIQFNGLRRQWRYPLYPGENRKWADLDCVRFQKAAGLSAIVLGLYGRGDYVVFDWKSDSSKNLDPLKSTTFVNISCLSESELEDFFVCLSHFVPQELLSPELLYLQVQTLSGHAIKNLSNYTQFWLEEYNRNFELSNYVPLAPGTICGNNRFTINMIVAARFNSSTYLATTNDGTKVVIKELVAPLDSDDSAQKKLLEQFNREAGILARLQHPHIVKVIDHFIENGRSYIVMNSLSGKNLREYVAVNGTLNAPQMLAIALQLAEVLQYLHAQNPPVLHRDFTPDNMIYSPDGTITVIDFGAANLYNTGKTATLIGKQSYMPPEQLRGKPTPASDVYAFGATLCYLLTGKDLPSMGKLPDIGACGLSNEVETLIKQCTAFDEAPRPESTAIIRQLTAGGAHV
jgi:tRNA A-37 threonylcarbamoyl transferase component Bud32